jgi:hypothetical protein
MAERPDDCQYSSCETAPAGALDFYFGVRWYCMDHYAEMVQSWEQTDSVDVYESPQMEDNQ